MTSNQEKQIAEQKSAIAALSTKLNALYQQLSERNILNDGLRLQVEDLKKNMARKDESSNIVSSAHRKAEIELETLNIRLTETQKSLESWKAKGLGNQSDEYEMLRVSESRTLLNPLLAIRLTHLLDHCSLHCLPRQF